LKNEQFKGSNQKAEREVKGTEADECLPLSSDHCQLHHTIFSVKQRFLGTGNLNGPEVHNSQNRFTEHDHGTEMYKLKK